MIINLITVGKIKEKYIKMGIDEFKKRLLRYCSLNIIEVKDEKAPENLSEKEMEIVKQREGDRILKKIPPNSYVIALAIEGVNLSSKEFSEKIQGLMIDGTNNITFIIGGSLGLSKEVLNKSHYKLSFSNMTFPHQLMRLILLEQIYRAFKIMKGEPYHK